MGVNMKQKLLMYPADVIHFVEGVCLWQLSVVDVLDNLVSATGLVGLESDFIYEDVSESCRTGRLERELQMVQLSAGRCSCIANL
jgi:hypothetical protein